MFQMLNIFEKRDEKKALKRELKKGFSVEEVADDTGLE